MNPAEFPSLCNSYYNSHSENRKIGIKIRVVI